MVTFHTTIISLRNKVLFDKKNEHDLLSNLFIDKDNNLNNSTKFQDRNISKFLKESFF